MIRTTVESRDSISFNDVASAFSIAVTEQLSPRGGAICSSGNATPVNELAFEPLKFPAQSRGTPRNSGGHAGDFRQRKLVWQHQRKSYNLDWLSTLLPLLGLAL